MFHNRKFRKTGDIACIFVHAGAGYHSVQNEAIHLQACNDAARAGITILRSGGSAVDAVEMAVKVLEDREITNAGYGSNLAMDGVVECDAVIVDHEGRSGAVGAVSQIKNPVHLARVVLDQTTKQLSLRRVPPNMLVGQGATDFAYDNGIPVVFHDTLVSPAAKERWRRWRKDLAHAESKTNPAEPLEYTGPRTPNDTDSEDAVRDQIRREHTKAMEQGVWNEAQPLTPPPTDPKSPLEPASPLRRPPTLPDRSDRARSKVDRPRKEGSTTSSPLRAGCVDPAGPPGMLDYNGRDTDASSLIDGSSISGGSSDAGAEGIEGGQKVGRETAGNEHFASRSSWHDGSSGSDSSASTVVSLELPSLTPSPPPASSPCSTDRLSNNDEANVNEEVLFRPACQGDAPLRPIPIRSKPKDRDDHITDTVGAIAVDSHGNIACAASSGGIGMKHRGRIGPAALNGVGAAVVPVDTDDKFKTAVAAVTSGTGEHMTTSLAGAKFAGRIYDGIKKGRGGALVEADNDEDVIRSVIEKDFMGHPSVISSASHGAIGVLCVKKTSDGVCLYFAHNTDSFAVASASADEPIPTVTMSRSASGGTIAQGGRMIRARKRKST